MGTHVARGTGESSRSLCRTFSSSSKSAAALEARVSHERRHGWTICRSASFWMFSGLSQQFLFEEFASLYSCGVFVLETRSCSHAKEERHVVPNSKLPNWGKGVPGLLPQGWPSAGGNVQRFWFARGLHRSESKLQASQAKEQAGAVRLPGKRVGSGSPLVFRWVSQHGCGSKSWGYAGFLVRGTPFAKVFGTCFEPWFSRPKGI